MNGKLTRREAIRAGLGAGCAAAATLAAPAFNLGRFRLFAWSDQEYSERAIRLVRESLVIDMLCLLALDRAVQSRWLGNPDAMTAEEFQEWADSGIDVIHPATGFGGPNVRDAVINYLASLNGLAASHDGFVRIDSADDFDKVREDGRIGMILGIQNAEHFRTANDVAFFHRLGQRVSQLTYNTRNLIGNGSTERRDEGLSDFGVEIVDRMNNVGMAVDVSHCGDRTTLDAFEVSTKPVLVTHSNCRALVPGHPRCKTDEAIRAMAASGGVMGITGVRMFVRAEEPTTIEHLLDHFDHVRDLVGVDHLGVGSDIDLHGYDDMPPEQLNRLRAGYKDSYAFREKIDTDGFDHPRRTYDLVEGLIRRGYTDEQIELILGGNFRRALAEIWAVQPEAEEEAGAALL